MSPSTVLNRIHDRAAELVDAQYRCWNAVLRPALNDAGVRVLAREAWTARQARWLRGYFRDEIMPVLSPLGLDPAHPFPKILNKSLNIVVVLHGRDAFGRAGHLAVVRAPRSLPRIIQLPRNVSGGEHDFVFLSEVLSAFVDELFPGMQVKGAYQFRVTRNSELIVDEEEVENLALALRDELVGRGYLRAMRLEIAANCPKSIVRTLLENFELTENAVYRIDGPVNLNRVIQVYDLVQRPELKYPTFQPRTLRDSETIFERVDASDVLLHHPFDAFTPVLELIRQAAEDPNVLAIKQTLYRTGRESQIVEHLVQAARNGKDVTVVVELRARFDEEANLGFADRLQQAGVQVVYGVVGYKTHAKMLLIVRREGRALRRYVHLGTGNYHAGNARSYTDLGLITADPDIGSDVHQIFQQLSGMAPEIKLRRLLQSPFTLHAGVLDKIEREAQHARAGRPARIIAKMNALNEPSVVRALYAASQAGVQVDLIVRGACTLQARRAGRVRQHPRALHRRPLPRAQPRVLVRQRRQAGVVLRERRLAGAQPDATRRNLFPDPRPCTGRARQARDARQLPRRQRRRVAAAVRWPVPARSARPRRDAAFGAGDRCSRNAAEPAHERHAPVPALRCLAVAGRRPARRDRPGVQQLPHGGRALRAGAAAHGRPPARNGAAGRGPGRARADCTRTCASARSNAWRASASACATSRRSACVRSPPTRCDSSRIRKRS